MEHPLQDRSLEPGHVVGKGLGFRAREATSIKCQYWVVGYL